MSETTLSSDAMTPMLRQYLRIKAEHPDSILMFRLGDFYEMFFEDAVLASKILDITLTSRNRNDPNPIPLCGVPHHSVEPYVVKLLGSGKKVAICDQVEDPKTAKGVVKREVTRVITPGVVPDGLGLDASSNNFLLSILPQDKRLGIAFADVSTGIFQAGEFSNHEQLFEELGRIEPREVLLPEMMSSDVSFVTKLRRLIPTVAITSMGAESFDSGCLSGLVGATSLLQSKPAASKAAAAVLDYLDRTQKGRACHIRAVVPYASERLMRMDDPTKRNLELTKTMRDGSRQGSLLDAIDRTMTAQGARKLKNWLLYPLLDPEEINARLDAVESIVSDTRFLRNLPQALTKIHDIERISSRAAMGMGNARDLIGLKESLKAIEKLEGELKGSVGLLGMLANSLNSHPQLIGAIEKQIVDEPPLALKEGGLIRAGNSQELDELRDIVAHGKDFVARLEAKEREATGIGSLKIRYNKVFGYYLEVTHTHRDKVPPYYIRKQTLVNAERFITPELKEYEEKILGAEEKVKQLEYAIFDSLRAKVGASSDTLLSAADAVANIDSLVSLARIASEYDYKRPTVDRGRKLEIKEGRHPIVERINPLDRFVPNDVCLNDDANLIMITGPNMAGKSTVMRQTALIVLLAQMGSFVPAREAHIGIVDRIFTRVGASDALAQGQSTFMVEMAEAAVILSEASPHSLIIIDEIGRGTSTFDGLAIAWAVAEDIHDRIMARTLFATHYHELTDLALTKPKIRNMHIAVKEWNSEVIFLRKLLPGATSRSYGIQVARLAGLPDSVIVRAKEVLENLESGELDEVGMPKIALPRKGKKVTSNPAQYDFFKESVQSNLVARLSEIDPNVITPIEALRLLESLKKESR